MIKILIYFYKRYLRCLDWSWNREFEVFMVLFDKSDKSHLCDIFISIIPSIKYNNQSGWQMLREQRSPKGQGLLRKEGPPTYAILSRNLVLSQCTRFLKGCHRALNENHPAFVELSTKTILLS